MADNVREALSAFMDNEASEFEVHRVLKESGSRSELNDAWWHYHLIGSAMRDELGSFGGIDLSDRVGATIADEAIGRVPGSAWRALVKPLAGVAVAASVTVAVLSGSQLYRSISENGAVEQTAAAGSPGPTVPVIGQSGVGLGIRTVDLSTSSPAAGPLQPGMATAETVAGDELAAQRLREYLYQHAENASLDVPEGAVQMTPVNAEEAR